MGCSIPQAGSKDKKREKGRACFKKKKMKRRPRPFVKGGKLLEGQWIVGCWRRIPAPFFQLFFGGQQGDGRLFNSKFSKDLHVWLKLSLGF
jgi:hypothetical protein